MQLNWDMSDGSVVTVDYDYTKGFPGSWDDPPAGPEVELNSITDYEGNEIKLPSEIEQAIITYIIENQEMWDEGEAADRAYDAWRDRDD